MIITELCVFTVNAGGGLTLSELHPGVSAAEVRAKTACSFSMSPGLSARHATELAAVS
jgi:3-oxoacid CoA-transferase